MKATVFLEIDLDKGETAQGALAALMGEQVTQAAAPVEVVPDTAPENAPEAPVEEPKNTKKRGRKTPKKEEAAQDVVEALDGEAVEEIPQAPTTATMDDLRAAAITALNNNKRTEVELIFRNHGAEKLVDLDPSTFADVLVELTALS